jgi:hypothetical protein
MTRYRWVSAAVLAVVFAVPARSDECPLPPAERQQAAGAFRQVLSVLRHPRCANCHGAMNVYDETTAHPGGAMVTVETDIFGESQTIPLGAEACVMCHNLAAGQWTQRTNPASEIQWSGLSDRELWQRLQSVRIITDPATRASQASTGALLLSHVDHDALIEFAFQGGRAMDGRSYMASYGLPEVDPPPLTKAEFVGHLREWIAALGAEDGWPQQDCSVALDDPPTPDAAAPEVARVEGAAPLEGASGGFVMVPNAGIPGYNNEVHGDVSLGECQQICRDRDWCRSVDYERAARRCYVQPVNLDEAPLNTNYPGHPYDHYSLFTDGGERAAPAPGGFVMVPNAGIPGYNNETHGDVSAEECLQICRDRDWCRSVDYERAARVCYVQPVNRDEVELNTNYPGNPYDHYSLTSR